MDSVALIDSYLDKSDWRVKENSSISFNLGALNLHMSGAVSADYYLKKVFSEKVAQAHKDCGIHLHDLSILANYCMGWSLRNLLDLGIPSLGARQASGPAKHLQSAIEQLVDFFGIVQNENAGAQAVSSFDTFLAPFIRADNLSERDVIQCMQMFLFGTNAPTRVGSQAPFTNITIDWECPADLKNKKALIANQEMDFTYGDCQPEMDLLNKCLLTVYENGDYNKRGFQYPIPTVAIDKDFNWDHPNCQLLFGLAAKYGTPYFSNFVSSDLKKEDLRSMCPLSGDTNVLIQWGDGVRYKDKYDYPKHRVFMSLKELYEKHRYDEMYTLSKEGWSLSRPVLVQPQVIRRIGLFNAKPIRMGEHHLQPIRRNPKGDRENYEYLTVEAKQIKKGDELPNVNCNMYDIGCGVSLCDDLINWDKLSWWSVTYNEVDGNDDLFQEEELYCMEVDNKEHLFVLEYGMITHNCRLRLDMRELKNKSGGLFGAGDSTGSVSVTTLNLPQLGYLTNKEIFNKEEFFWKKLDELLEIAYEASETRRKFTTELMEKGLYPYTSFYLGTLDNHFSTIGLIGMHEMLLNMFGRQTGIQSKEGKEFAVRVLKHIKEKCSDFQVRSGNLYNLESTPAEGVCNRFAKHDVENFPDIITSGKPGNHPYYTNSSNLPVGFTFDIFKALEHQEQLQLEYTGGTVFHIFLSQSLSGWEIARDLIKKITSISRLPYFTISPTYSICEHHGFLLGEHKICPICTEEQVVQYERKLKEYEFRLKQLEEQEG